MMAARSLIFFVFVCLFLVLLFLLRLTFCLLRLLWVGLSRPDIWLLRTLRLLVGLIWPAILLRHATALLNITTWLNTRITATRPTWPTATDLLFMSTGISSKIIIANGVASPIRMASFPSMKTFHPEWISDQPDTARSQIEILVTN